MNRRPVLRCLSRYTIQKKKTKRWSIYGLEGPTWRPVGRGVYFKYLTTSICWWLEKITPSHWYNTEINSFEPLSFALVLFISLDETSVWFVSLAKTTAALVHRSATARIYTCCRDWTVIPSLKNLIVAPLLSRMLKKRPYCVDDGQTLVESQRIRKSTLLCAG